MTTKVKVLLIFSVVLNLALMAGWWLGQPAAEKVVAPSVAASATTADKTKGKVSKTPLRTVTVTKDKQLDWASVESEDYRKYIANLRAVGCPEETIRDIIIADVNKLYAGKIAALYPSPKDMKFWRVYDRNAKNEEHERDKKRHELEQEKNDLIKELLGIDYDSDYARMPGRPTDDDWRYGFLSPEKQAQAKALHDKYREKERALFSDGGLTPENRAKFAALRAEREAEMAKLLGSDDFEEYQLRNSWTARHMRDNLTAFQPSENEFRNIFQLQKTYDDQFAFTRDGSDDALRDQRKQAQQQLEEQLKGILGDDRYREFQLSQDERFRDIYDFAQRNDLPRQTAEGVYQVRVAAELEKQRIQSDQSLSADARQAALIGLVQQTSGTLAKVLGQGNWPSYEQSRDSRWIARLGQQGDSNHSSHNRYSRH